MILEFHDDVLVVDSPVTPNVAAFYQVKTLKNGCWKISDLLRAAKPGKKPAKNKASDDAHKPGPRSVLGKLVDHVAHFAPHIRTLNLVSNAAFDVPLASLPAGKEREEIHLVDLDAQTLAKVKESLQAELATAEPPPIELVFLLVNGMSVTGHEKHGAGELAAFLEARRPGAKYAVQSLFRTLLDEIGRRAKHEWQPSSFEELCRQRGLCRADVDRLLLVADSHRDPEQDLREVRDQLQAEDVTYREIVSLAGAWRRYQVQTTDHADETLMTLKAQVTAAVQRCVGSAAWSRLIDLVSLVEAEYVSAHGELEAPLDRAYLRGAILLEYKAIEGRGLSQVDPKPAEKTP